MKTMNHARPLLMPAIMNEDGSLTAGWGRFHGGRIGDMFEVISHESVGTISTRETIQGTARLQSLGEDHAVFQAEWINPTAPRPANLWLKAVL